MDKKADVIRCLICIKKIQCEGTVPLKCLYEDSPCLLIKEEVFKNEEVFTDMLADINNTYVNEKDGFPDGVKIKIDSSYVDSDSIELLKTARDELVETVRKRKIVN